MPKQEASQALADTRQYGMSVMPTLSPLSYLGYETEEVVSQKGTKYIRYVVSFRPKARPDVVVKTSMLRQEWERIDALLLLNPKANITFSNVEVNGKQQTRIGVLNE